MELILGALIWGLTFGSFGASGKPLFADTRQSDSHHILLAIAGGAIFNVANLLLVAAIDIAGLAVAFPVGIGLALVVGAVSSYVIAPNGNPLLLFGGVALVVVAIVLDALAYRVRESQRRSVGARGVVISLIAGLLMGSFYPFVSKAMTGSRALGLYAIALVFVLGVALCALPANYILMLKPIAGGRAVAISGDWSARGHTVDARPSSGARRAGRSAREGDLVHTE